MSNVKQIRIRGLLPFNVYEIEDFVPMLAFLSSPVSGLRINWSGGPVKYVDNEHGGRTALYRFVLEGTEAVSYRFLERFVNAVKQHGEIEKSSVIDLEA